MKKTIALLVIMSFLTPPPLFAETPCQWKTVTKVEGGYLYPKECHIEVGKSLKENDLREVQTAKLEKAIELKDLAISKADERALVWQENNYKQFERIQKQDRIDKYENWTLFGGGFVLGMLSAFIGGKAMGK